MKSFLKANQGSSLIEVIVSVAVGSMVMAGVADVSLQLFKSQKKFEQNMGAVFEANLISQSLKNKIYIGGGNGMTPWQTVAVENNCTARLSFPNCHGTDRITTVTNEIKKTGANKSFVPNLPVYQYNVFTGLVTFLDPTMPSAVCPLNPNKMYQHILIADRGSNKTALRWVVSMDAANCTLATQADVQGAILNDTTGLSVFLNPTLYSVEINTFYLDVTHRQLNILSKTTNEVTPAPGEVKLLSNDVYDFQVAIGYDVGIKDLLISNNHSNTDEILFNAANDTFATLGGVGAQRSDLQGIFVSFVTGQKLAGRNDRVRNFDGPFAERPNYQLLSYKEKFTFRNLGSYQ